MLLHVKQKKKIGGRSIYKLAVFPNTPIRGSGKKMGGSLALLGPAAFASIGKALIQRSIDRAGGIEGVAQKSFEKLGGIEGLVEKGQEIMNADSGDRLQKTINILGQSFRGKGKKRYKKKRLPSFIY